MISVTIPVYRESENLEEILEKLKGAEVIVVIDEPTEKMKKLREKFKNFKFIFREKRKGKWSALNLGIDEANGDIIVFLDSDVKIEENFLNLLKEEFKDCDLLDFIKITERRNFWERMIYYDYLGYNFANFILKDKTIGLNGAGFAINRKIKFRKEILEDMDYAIQCYERNLKYKLSKIKILVGCPKNIKEWVKQRKRWYLGAWIWVKKNLRTILRFIKEKPISIISAALTFPITFSFPFLFLGFGCLLVGFLISLTIFWTLSSYLDLYFNPFEFFIYYFFYQPINIFLFLISPFFKEVDWVC